MNLWKIFKEAFKRVEEIESFNKRFAALQVLEQEYKIRAAAPVYSYIAELSADELRFQFWPWAKSLLVTKEYKYLMMLLRDKTIHEMVGVNDPSVLIRLSSRLDTLQIIDRYLVQGVEANEDEIRRHKTDAARRAD